MSDPSTANRRRALVLLAAVFVAVATVLAILGLLVGLGWLAPVLAVVLAAPVPVAAWWRSDRLALRLSGARPSTPTDHPRLHNLVEGLCAASGLPKPALHVVDDPALNALTVGRDEAHASLVVTTGMMEAMTRVELEAILAHELSHVRGGDVVLATLAVGGRWFGAGRLLDPHRESVADAVAVETTRYPPALASALTKLRDDRNEVRASSPAIRHLWIEAPGQDSRNGSEEGAAGLDDRITALQDL